MIKKFIEYIRNLIATIAVSADPRLKRLIVDGMNTPLSECLSESEVEWCFRQ